MVTGANVAKQQDPLQKEQKRCVEGEDTPLVGPRNEGEVEVNGMKCRALIDYGSQITSITHEYYP